VNRIIDKKSKKDDVKDGMRKTMFLTIPEIAKSNLQSIPEMVENNMRVEKKEGNMMIKGDNIHINGISQLYETAVKTDHPHVSPSSSVNSASYQSSTPKKYQDSISNSTKANTISCKISHKKMINDGKVDDIKEFIIQKSNFLSSIKLERPFKSRILIDTGAEGINIISNNHYLKYFKSGDCTKLQKCNLIVVPMGGQPLKTLGSIDLKLSFGNNNITEEIPLIVVESLSQYDIILGLPAIQQLNIMQTYRKER